VIFEVDGEFIADHHGVPGVFFVLLTLPMSLSISGAQPVRNFSINTSWLATYIAL
jgi:hypothetical protein